MSIAAYYPSYPLIAAAAAAALFGVGYFVVTSSRPRKLDRQPWTELRMRELAHTLHKVTRPGNALVRWSRDDLHMITAFYERWLNLAPELRSELREELAAEGIDMLKLGDAIRAHRGDAR